MSEKRFFEIDYDEILYYVIDSLKLKRKKDDFEDEEDFKQYCLENSLIGIQVINLLNELADENEALKRFVKNNFNEMMDSKMAVNENE